jgi:hypothetical protein
MSEIDTSAEAVERHAKIYDDEPIRYTAALLRALAASPYAVKRDE